MTPQDMLDYAFGLVDEPRRYAFDREMASDPALADRVVKLGSSLNLLLDDGDALDPPPDLADRAAAVVEARRRRPHFQDFTPSRVPFRWSDVAVAATVFFAAILTLTVPLMRSRAQMDQAACAFNLGKLGVGLARYATTHGTYPLVPASYPVGTYGVMLHDAHILNDPAVLTCPSAMKDRPAAALPDYEKFCELVNQSPEACRELLAGHFAYNVGYHISSGKAVAVPDSPANVTPIASDGPANDREGHILDGNSPNHGGRGQNVLYSDGHVGWKPTRWVSHVDHDLFLNNAHRPAPGLHAGDSALVPSVMPVSLK